MFAKFTSQSLTAVKLDRLVVRFGLQAKQVRKQGQFGLAQAALAGQGE